MENSLLFECIYLNALVKNTIVELCIACLFAATVFKIPAHPSVTGVKCIEKSVHFLLKQRDVGLTFRHRNLNNINRQEKKMKRPCSTYGGDQQKAKKLGFSHLCWAAFHLWAYGIRQIHVAHYSEGCNQQQQSKICGWEKKIMSFLNLPES